MSDLRSTGMTCEIHGEGEALLMLHGLGGTSNTFSPLMPALSAYRTIRPDLPGAGRSQLSSLSFGVDEILSNLINLLDMAHVDRFHVVGHSFGTLIGQHLAVRLPERVQSLTLYGAMTEPAQASREGLRARAEQVRSDGMAGCADAIVAGSLSPATRRNNPLAEAFVRESIMRQTRDGYAANCLALAGVQAADATRFQCPVMVVTGRDDGVTPVSMGQEIVDRCGQGVMHALDQCGHWTPVEKPDECANLQRNFLSQNAARTR
jgi:pimeloyl-ACP methyl ester carboxylesterase